MKKITLLFNLLFLFTIGSYAQCIRTTQFPSSAIVSNNFGYSQTVATCNFTTEYAQVDGLLIGENYVFTCTLAGVHNYITVTDLSDNVITFGVSPLAISGMPIDQIRLHYSDDDSCAGQTGCHITTVLRLLSCPIPTNSAVSNATTTSADFTWEPGGVETAWEVLILPAGSPAPTDADAGIATTALPYTDSTLMPSTDYVFYVRSNCGTEFSPWSLPLAFSTLCEAVDFVDENFDNITVPSFPACWKRVGTGGNTNTQATAGSPSSPNVMYIYSSSDTVRAVVAFPQVNNADTGLNWLRFDVRANFTVGGNLEIGYLEDPSDDTTFVSVSTVVANSTTSWESFAIPVAAITTSQTLAFRNAGVPAYSVLIDNVKWELMPSCIFPTAIVNSNVTASSATVSWDASVTVPANGYQYYISDVNTAPDDTTVPTANVLTGLTVDIAALNPNTDYFVWIRSACSATDFSSWSNKTSFHTQCLPNVDLPWTESFEALTAGATNVFPDCWGYLNTLSNWSISATYATTGLNSLKRTWSTNGWAFTPPTTLTAGVSYTFSYMMRTADTVVGYNVNVAVGEAQSSDAMTNVLNSIVDYQNPTWSEFTFEFVPTTTGNYSFGVSVVAPVAPNGIYFDDFRLEVSPACRKPSALVADAASISENSANVTWTDSTSAPAAYDYYMSTSNTAPDATTVATGQSVAGLNFVDLYDLSPATTYFVWVRSVCSATDSSAWSSAVSFTTLCSALGIVPTYENDFSAVAACWTYNNAGDISTGPTGNLAGIWTVDGFLNAGTTGAMKVNLYSTDRVGWMITPTLDLSSGNNNLSFDYAVSNWNGVDAIAMGSDDTVQVLLSEDDGASWSSIALFDVNAGVSNSSNAFLANLTSTSPTAKIAFLATDGLVNDLEDYDFFIDNLKVESGLGTSTLHTNTFNYYPNPVKNILNINTQNISNVAVFNLLGQQVATKAAANNTQIDMSNLSSGTYLVKVTADNQVKTIKVVKE